MGRGTRIDPDKTDCLIVDLGGNVERFGKVEDIVFEQGKIWRMFGSGGRLLSGIPIHDIGKYTKADTAMVDRQAAQPIENNAVRQVQGRAAARRPEQYRQWMIRTFDWNAKNENYALR